MIAPLPAARTADQPTPVSLCDASSDALDVFVDRMGDHIEAEGMPRIAGRLFGLLLLETRPVSFSDLADRLHVSRGSISTNARLLETKGLIVRLRPEGERQEFFSLADDPYTNMIRGIALRMQETRTTIASAEEMVPADRPERARLCEARQFFETFTTALCNLADTLACGGRTRR